MHILELIVEFLTMGPRTFLLNWLGIATGLILALIAYTFLPETVDRASIAALAFFGGWILVFAIGRESKKSK